MCTTPIAAIEALLNIEPLHVYIEAMAPSTILRLSHLRLFYQLETIGSTKISIPPNNSVSCFTDGPIKMTLLEQECTVIKHKMNYTLPLGNFVSAFQSETIGLITCRTALLSNNFVNTKFLFSQTIKQLLQHSDDLMIDSMTSNFSVDSKTYGYRG